MWIPIFSRYSFCSATQRAPHSSPATPGAVLLVWSVKISFSSTNARIDRARASQSGSRRAMMYCAPNSDLHQKDWQMSEWKPRAGCERQRDKRAASVTQQTALTRRIRGVWG